MLSPSQTQTQTKLSSLNATPHLIKNCFTPTEIQILHTLYAQIITEESTLSLTSSETSYYNHPNIVADLKSTTHTTVFLHANSLIDRLHPELLKKIIDVMFKADLANNWELVSSYDKSEINLRVLEYHSYSPTSSISYDRHCDGGSLVSMSVMLSEDGEFEGGEFEFLEKKVGVWDAGDLASACEKSETDSDEEEGEEPPSQYYMSTNKYNKCDAVIFPSEKFHSVQEIMKGNRRTLVCELWRGKRCVVDRFI